MVQRAVVATFLVFLAVNAGAQSVLQRAQEARAAGAYTRAIQLLREAESARPALETELLLAETLAWNKEFAESAEWFERIRAAHPQLRDATLGLARVRLWQGRYAEARRLFAELLRRNGSDAEAVEGLGTAAYWSGDYRLAEREFSRIHTDFAQRSLAEIRAGARSGAQLDADHTSDDQPFRSTRTSLRGTFFTDPLTRWDASIGAYRLSSVVGGTHQLPFAIAQNETVFPPARLTLSTSLGGLRTPGDRTHFIGSAAARFRLWPHSTLSLSVAQREIVTNATRLYPFVRSTAIRWQLDGKRLASVGAERLRYSDENSGLAADGYVLLPLLEHRRWAVRAGASALYRDTRDLRFYVTGISSSLDPGSGHYRYTYRGAYNPYWTPDNLVEGRVILGLEARVGSSAVVRLQGDGGRARDTALGFWPDRGAAPFPATIGSAPFRRMSSPRRLRFGVDTPLSHDLFLAFGFEHSVTAFYEANAFHATVGRRR